MQEIRCPKCGEVFQVDDSGYDQIAQQVRDREFEKELDRRKKDLDAKREQELEIIRLQEEKEHTASITQKDAEISEKDQKIAELQAKLDASETAKKLAVAEAVEQKNVELSQKVTEIANLKGELKSNGFISMITQHSWMFQSSYSKLRDIVLMNCPVSLIHLGARAFDEIGGEVVQTCSFIIKKHCIPSYNGRYIRLIGGESERDKEQLFYNKQNYFSASVKQFERIDDHVLSYWMS